MTRQIKLFFSNKTSDHSDAETGTELKMQLLLLSGTCVIVTILYFLYTLVFKTDTFTLTSNYVLLGIFMIAFMAYYAIQFLLYMMVNGTFFEQTENKKFLTSRLFLSSLEGILLFPAIVLLAFLHFSSSSIIISDGLSDQMRPVAESLHGIGLSGLHSERASGVFRVHFEPFHS